jgi:hypothetical protein
VLVSPYDHARHGGVAEHARGLAAELSRCGHSPDRARADQPTNPSP